MSESYKLDAVYSSLNKWQMLLSNIPPESLVEAPLKAVSSKLINLQQKRGNQQLH